jgi:hypothetical protein
MSEKLPSKQGRFDSLFKLFAKSFFVFVFSFLSLVPQGLVVAASGTPKVISYQGRLTDSTGNLLGGTGTNYFFKFSIWNNSTVGLGTKLWPQYSH